jgi:septum formation protein
MQITNYQIVLASNSPRRQELLKMMGIDFRIKLKAVQEDYPDGLMPEEVALYLCKKKAMAFEPAEIGKNELLITADTIVCLDTEILNKPADRIHAREMLKKLSGKKHTVITGVALRSVGKTVSFAVSTDVFFKVLSDEMISHYIDNFHPYDKAGGYGIQEWIGFTGIEKIDGSYFNVMGLPTARLFDELLRF